MALKPSFYPQKEAFKQNTDSMQRSRVRSRILHTIAY